ncbi:hypothetical protein CN609_26445 [Bacillus wiedmannii]|nr:hypothetical protein CN609_26445 [Bacillus wiedmannii]
MNYNKDFDIERLACVCIQHGQFQSVFSSPTAILGAGRGVNTGVRKNIRFLTNNIIEVPGHEWREKVCFTRR